MTTPNNPAPIAITPQTPPEFPCWGFLVLVRTQEWKRFRTCGEYKCYLAGQVVVTHWHPDQPTAPEGSPSHDWPNDNGRVVDHAGNAVETQPAPDAATKAAEEITARWLEQIVEAFAELRPELGVFQYSEKTRIEATENTAAIIRRHLPDQSAELAAHRAIGEACFHELNKEGGTKHDSIPEAIRELVAELSQAREEVARLKQHELAVNELVKVAGWSDPSPIHALLHVENLISNLKCDARVVEKERDALKSSLAAAVKERDEYRQDINGVLEECAKHITLSNDFPWAEEVHCAFRSLEESRDEARGDAIIKGSACATLRTRLAAAEALNGRLREALAALLKTAENMEGMIEEYHGLDWTNDEGDDMEPFTPCLDDISTALEAAKAALALPAVSARRKEGEK